jgi:acrylyl-CoA reductase (NADPH)
MAERFRAILLEERDGKVSGDVREVGEDQLPEGDVTVAVDYSDLNYKDGLILNGLGGLVRSYPHVPGVDFAGTVAGSAHPNFAEGDRVILTGWRVGESRWGGYAQRARVKGDWLVKVPEGFDTRWAMAMGTAGFTAALAVMKLEDYGIRPADDGELLITGAGGGVGSVAVALAARHGFKVAASTGRRETHEYLYGLGAASIVDRKELSEGPVRPLEKERWIGAVDSVGSTTLARVLSQIRHRGAVASCGLAGGNDLPATVIPFLLRGISLLGIDSVLSPLPERRRAWDMLTELPKELVESMMDVVPLADVLRLGGEILQGRTRGRVVVDVNA